MSINFQIDQNWPKYPLKSSKITEIPLEPKNDWNDPKN